MLRITSICVSGGTATSTTPTLPLAKHSLIRIKRRQRMPLGHSLGVSRRARSDRDRIETRLAIRHQVAIGHDEATLCSRWEHRGAWATSADSRAAGAQSWRGFFALSLHACRIKIRRLLARLPLDVAANAGNLFFRCRFTCEQCIECAA